MQRNQNNLKVRSPTINKIIKKGEYDADDITEAEKRYIQMHTPKPRVPRSDLQCGDLVVLLEGGYMGKKAVFLKQLDGCIALVSGIRSVNGMPTVKIDERYLLKLSTSLPLSSFPDVDVSGVPESRIGEAERMDEDGSDETPVERAVMDAVQKVKFMKTYFAEPFVVDTTTDFYAQNY